MVTIRASLKHLFLTATAISVVAVGALSAAPAYAVSLKEALESTYNTNPALKSQRESLAVTDEKVSLAVSEWRPTVRADVVEGRQKLSFGGASPTRSDKETNQISVEQPIFNGGGSIAKLHSAKFQVAAERAQLTAVEHDLFLQAITAYMDVVRDQSVAGLSKNNVEVLEQQLGASKDRFDVGEVTRTDVAQSQARLARAISDEAQADGAVTSSNASFKKVIGVDPQGLEPHPALPELPANLDEAKAYALEHSPVLNRARFSEEALSKEIRFTQSRLLPSVTLNGLMRREQGAGVSGNSDFDTDELTLNASIPLYQSGAEYSRVRAAKKDRERAKYDAIDTQQEVIEKVTRAWENLETTRASIKANASAIEAAEVALDGVKQEQMYGARTVLDVLDAEQELFSAKVNQVRSERNEVVAVFTLLSVMGKLTPEYVGLDVKTYDPEEHYDSVKNQLIGF